MTEEVALFGAGCFWCVEAVFKELRGVHRVRSGYAGGSTDHPTYAQVCTGRTGHAEAVEIAFDPQAIGYADLLRVFFATHDPTTLNRQGADVGTQYRSAIFPLTEAQASTAREVKAEIAAAGLYPDPIVTTIEPGARFWPAEPEHDDYFARNPGSGYCQAVIAPKLRKFRQQFVERLKAHAA
jgi:peptide-methionine (S)-S-oxide reductase